MKRKLTSHNAIRHLRKCLGITQSAFAKRYKLTARQIQVMELGQRAVSHELARQWSLDYGVDADSMKRPIGFARMLGGKRATTSLVANWTDIQAASAEDRHRASEQALSQLNAILQCCTDKNFPGVMSRLGDAFESLVSDYRMKPALSEYLDRCGTVSAPQQMTIGEVNVLCSRSPEWRKLSDRYSPNEIAIVKDRRVPLWLRLGPAMLSGFRVEMTVTLRNRRHSFGFHHFIGLQIKPL